MKLYIGLGNPGKKYAYNRHNIGFMIVDEIARQHGFTNWRKRFQGEVAEGQIKGEKCLLLKPGTYMNESGRAAGEACRFYKIPLEDVIVFHDELDLRPGKIRVKTGGGFAGHNGLKSLTAHIGNDYIRVRIGIGHPGQKNLVHNYVLRDFAKADAVWLDPLLDAIARAAPHLATGDNANFMNQVALLTKAEETKTSNKTQPKQQDKNAVDHGTVSHKGKNEGSLAEKLKAWLSSKESGENN